MPTGAALSVLPCSEFGKDSAGLRDWDARWAEQSVDVDFTALQVVFSCVQVTFYNGRTKRNNFPGNSTFQERTYSEYNVT